MQHHRRTAVVGDSEPVSEIRNIWQYVWYALNWDYILAFARMSLGSLFDYFPFFVRTQKAYCEVKVDAWLSLGVMAGMLWLTWLFPLQTLLLYWLPVQLAFSLNFFYVIGEHSGVDAGDDLLKNTQTFAQQNMVFKFFNHNSNFHAAHHCFPQVPPDNIPAAHKLIEEKLKYSPVGYIELNFQLLRSLLKSPLRSVPPPPSGRETSFFIS
jgi:fatty acid desaturase